ncbi:MAG: hypothetical protein AB1589_31075 [Cyanobacteriota bacterium]
MIHHISIPARNPFHVANVLAEVLNGWVAPFPPNINSHVVIAGDEYGTLIEIYPLGSEIMPGHGTDQATFCQNAHPYAYTAIHAAISVPTNQDAIEQIGAREGWRVLPCNRDGLFEVIEFWVENRLMLELLTPAIAPQYLTAMKSQNLELLMAELSNTKVRT